MSEFALGDEFLARFPRQPEGGEGILKEARVTPLLAKSLPVAVPEVIGLGAPGFGYPEPWAVTRRLPGIHPAPAEPGAVLSQERLSLAQDLAAVVLAMRAMEPPSPIPGDLRWYRGGALAEFDASFRRYLGEARAIADFDVDLVAAERMWNDALRLPGASEPCADRWYHGDLVAENLLVSEGRLTAVLDLGSVSVGDPTVDLHGAWEIFDGPARSAFAEHLGVTEAEWLRGRAWALGISLSALAYYWHTMPGRRRDRLAMLRNALGDA